MFRRSTRSADESARTDDPMRRDGALDTRDGVRHDTRHDTPQTNTATSTATGPSTPRSRRRRARSASVA